MKVEHYRDIEPLSVEGIEEATEGLTIRRLISEVDGATEFTMDVFEIEPGGHSAYHEHDWEHQIFVLSGGEPGAGATPSETVPPHASRHYARMTMTSARVDFTPSLSVTSTDTR